MTLFETKNKAFIRGILNEVKLKEGTDKNGSNYINGEVVIKAMETLDGIKYETLVPVSVFVSKLTKAGAVNKNYSGLVDFMNNAVSVAAAPDGVKPSVVSAGYPSLTGETFMAGRGQDKRLATAQRIKASSFYLQDRDLDKTYASWDIVGMISEMGYELDDEGIPTNKFTIRCITIGFANRPEEIVICTRNEGIAKAIQANFNIGETANFFGVFNFTQEVETYKREVTIGTPRESTRTKSTKEYVITGADMAEGSDQLDPKEVAEVIALRDEYAMKKASATTAAAPTANTAAAPASNPNTGWGGY